MASALFLSREFDQEFNLVQALRSVMPTITSSARRCLSWKAILALVVSVAPSSTIAAQLNPGDVLDGPSLHSHQRDVADTLQKSEDLLTAPGFSARIYASAVEKDSTNPLGGLTFIYRIYNLPESSLDVDQMSIVGLGKLDLNVRHYSDDRTVIMPATVSRNPNGSRVRFAFHEIPMQFTTGAIEPGELTPFLVLHTSATHYARSGTLSLRNESGGTASTSIFVPIPEPSTIALVACSLFGFAPRALRRQYLRHFRR